MNVRKVSRGSLVAGVVITVGLIGWTVSRPAGGGDSFAKFPEAGVIDAPPDSAIDAAIDAPPDAPDAATGEINPNVAWTRVEIASHATCGGADGTNLADYDGDGDLDITVACEQGNKVIVARNNACASSWTVTAIATGLTAPEDSRFGDVDGDGDLDIIVAESGGMKIRWYANSGAPNYSFGSSQTINSGAQRFMHALVLSPGVVIAGGYSTGAAVDRYVGSGSSWTRTQLSTAGWVKGLEAHGADILVWDYTGSLRGVRWILNAATSGTAGDRLTTDAFTLRGTKVGNDILTAIGSADGVSAVGSSFKIIGQASPTYPSSFGRIQAVSYGDVDDDGVNDMVMSASHAGATTDCVTADCDTAVSSVLWLKGPAFTQRGEVSGTSGIKHDNVTIGDLNCDGFADLAVTEEKHQGLSMYANPLGSN